MLSMTFSCSISRERGFGVTDAGDTRNGGERVDIKSFS
jgi:hypothetical protein